MADELGALAQACRCQDEPIALVVETGTPSFQLLAVLSLLEQAGFHRVEVGYQGQRVVLSLDEQPLADTTTFRALGGGVWSARAPLDSPALDLTQLCAAQACSNARLTVAEEAALDTWWQAARSLAAANGGHVAVEIDSQRRPASPRKLARVVGPVSQISADDVRERLFAEYAPLRSCLLEAPVAADAPSSVDLSIDVGPNGEPTKVRIAREPKPSPTTTCLRKAVSKMSFRAPHFGSGHVKIPFALRP